MASGRPIDEKIVQLTLENSDFEERARQSVKTFADMNNTFSNTNNIDLSNVTRGIEELNNRFSLTGTIARRAYEAVADSVVGMGMKSANALKSLTIGGVKDGFREYSKTIDMVKVLKNSTGKSVKYINTELDALNEYSDKTIYSYQDMVQNVTKFTNNGISLKKATAAIKGVSNLAALSGADANQASRAMLNFSQAIATGSMKLIDWKSITNAGMDTVQFKKQLLETALAMGTVVKKGKQYVSTTTDMQGKTSNAFTATKGWNEALKSNWISTEVLTETLNRYGDATTKIGKKAFTAAQQITTFSKLQDTVVESIGSQWAKAFRIIIGDLDEATVLWTAIGTYLGDAIDTAGEAMKGVLEGWKKLKGRDDLIKGLAEVWKVVVDILKPVANFFIGFFPNSIDTTSKKLASATKLFRDIATTLHGITEPISDTLGVFTKIAGEIFGPIVATGIKLLANGLAIFLHMIRPISEAIGIVGEFIRILWDTGKALIMNFTPIGAIVTTLSKKFDWFADAIKKPFDFISTALRSVKDNLEKINPANMLKDVSAKIKDGSMTIGEAFLYVINNVFKSIKSGIKDLFNKTLMKKVIERAGLSGLVDRIKDFFNGLKKVKIFDTLTKAAMLLFGVILLIGDGIKNALQSQIVKDAVDRFKNLEKAIAAAYKNGTLFVNLFKKIGLSNFIKKDANGKEYVDLLGTINSYLVDIKDYFAKIQDELKKIKTIFDEQGIQGVFDYITNWIANTFTVDNFVKVIKGIGTAILSVGLIIANFGYDLAKKLLPKSVIDKIDEFRKGFTQNGFLDKIAKTFEKVRKMLKDGKSVADIFKSLRTSFESLFGGKKSNSKKGSKGLLDIKNIVIGVGGLLAAIIILKTLIPKATGVLGDVSSVFTRPFKSITDSIDNAGKAAKAIGFGAKLVGIAMVLFSFKKLAEGFEILSNIKFGVLRRRAELILVFLGVLGGITKTFGKGSNIFAMGFMLIGLGNALVRAAEALDMMSNIKDPRKAITIFGSVILAIVGLMTAAAFLKVGAAVSALLLSIAIAMMGIAVAMRMFSSMDTKQFDTAEHRLFAIFADIGIFMQAFRGMRISGIASTLLSLSLSLIVLFGVVKLFSTMDYGYLAEHGGKVALVMAAIAGFFFLMSKSGNVKYFKGVASTILAISVSMYILGNAIQLFKKVEWKDMLKAAATLTGLVVATLLIATVVSSLDPKGLIRVGSMMVMMATSFAIFALAMAALSLVPNMTNGFIALGEFIAFTFVLSSVAKNINKLNTFVMATMMIVLAGAFVLFASGMQMLVKVPWETVIASLLGFAAVMAVFTLMAKGAKGIGTNMFVLAAGMLVLSLAFIAFTYSLQYLKGVDAAAIAAAMGGFIATMATFSLLGPVLNTCSIGMLSFGATMILLAAAVYILAKAIEILAPILGPTLSSIGDTLMSGFKAIGDTVLPILEGLWKGISGVFTTIANGVTWFTNLFGKMFGGLSSNVDNETQKLQQSTERLNNINASASTDTSRPVGGTSMQSMMKQLSGSASGDMNKEAQKLKEDVASAKSTSVGAIKSYGEDVSKAVSESKDGVKNNLDGWNLNVTDTLRKFTDNTKQSFSDGSKDINETINGFTKSLGKDVDISSLGGLTDKIDLSTKGIPDTVTKNVSSGSGKVKKASKKLAKDSKDAIKAEWKDLQLGKYLTKGCIKGLDSSTVETKARGLAKKAIKAMKEELGVHSPSKVAEQLFRYVAEGGALGLDHGSSDLIASARKMSSGALDEISSLLDEDFATKFTPEVSPILDMDAMNGINSSLSGLNANVGLRAPNIQNGFGMSNGTEVNGVSVNVNIMTTGRESPEDIARIARQSAQEVITDEVRKIVWR